MRLFFALFFSPAEAKAIARIAADAPDRERRRTTPTENLHLTVLFLGERDPAGLDELHEAGDKARNEVAPFALHLDRREYFWSGRGSRRPDQAYRWYTTR